MGLCGVLPPLLATYSKSSLWPRLRVAAHISGRGLRREVAAWQLRRPQGPPYTGVEAGATVYLLFSSTAPGSYRWARPFTSSRRGLRLRGLLGGETITVSGGARTLQWPRSRRPLQAIPETSLSVRPRLSLSAPARYLLASGGAGPIGPGLCWLLL